jgi:hypothetical protein
MILAWWLAFHYIWFNVQVFVVGTSASSSNHMPCASTVAVPPSSLCGFLPPTKGVGWWARKNAFVSFKGRFPPFLVPILLGDPP